MASDVKNVSSDELASQWGLVRCGEGARYVDDTWGLAALIRREIDRRGIATTREVLSTLRPLLSVIGEDSDESSERLKSVLGELADLGEIERGTVNRQPIWIKPLPRWIRLGPSRAALVGTISVADDIHQAPDDRRSQFVRWFNPRGQKAGNALDAHGVDEESFAKWLGPPGWLNHADQSTSAGTSLAGLWHHYCHELEREGLPLGDSGNLMRVVRPLPGTFFGRVGVESIGRWSNAETLPRGVFLGAQKGFSDEHWHPILVQIEGDAAVRSLFLPDWDRFNWLLLGRGLVVGPEEQVTSDIHTGELHFSFPLPNQIRRVLRLIATPSGKWRWLLSSGVDPDLWQIWRH